MYWSGDRLWEGCEGCVGENGELFCVHSIFHPLEVLQNISKCVPGFLQSDVSNTVASYGSRGRERQGWYVRFSV